MYVCYIDESGTPDIPGNTSHFVLAGISIPIRDWRAFDGKILGLLKKAGLEGEEFHTAWLLRKYLEQSKIPSFEKLDWAARRAAVEKQRNIQLLQMQKTGSPAAYRQAKKTFKHTKAYIHLTLDERRALVLEVADCVAGWRSARLFAECIDKTHFDPTKGVRGIDEQAFEQVVSRFEKYLVNSEKIGQKNFGLLVHDNNDTVARKHTALMRQFHATGTLWTKIDRIVDTPLFVNSSLTSMVQIADLCAYALRRYLENNEDALFKKIFTRADRVNNTVVGVRHFADQAVCKCAICTSHSQKALTISAAAKKQN